MSQRQVKQMPLHWCCSQLILYQALELFLTARITEVMEGGDRGESNISRVLFSTVQLRGVIYLRRLLPDACSGSKAVEPVKDQPWFL